MKSFIDSLCLATVTAHLAVNPPSSVVTTISVEPVETAITLPF